MALESIAIGFLAVAFQVPRNKHLLQAAATCTERLPNLNQSINCCYECLCLRSCSTPSPNAYQRILFLCDDLDPSNSGSRMSVSIPKSQQGGSMIYAISAAPWLRVRHFKQMERPAQQDLILQTVPHSNKLLGNQRQYFSRYWSL